jgi:hypothetical protein
MGCRNERDETEVMCALVKMNGEQTTGKLEDEQVPRLAHAACCVCYVLLCSVCIGVDLWQGRQVWYGIGVLSRDVGAMQSL